MNQLALADQEHQNNSATVDDSGKEAVEKISMVNNPENNEMNKSSSSSLAKNINMDCKSIVALVRKFSHYKFAEHDKWSLSCGIA